MNLKHGHTKRKWMSPTYRVWSGVRQRCGNPRCHEWQHYGGRGIKLYEPWFDFAKFLADVGERPDGKELDRFPNNDGNYEPGNVRWVSRRDNMNNTRANRFIEFRGERLSVSQWSRRTGISSRTLIKRLNSGWPIETVLTAPVMSYRGGRGKQWPVCESPSVASSHPASLG